MPKFRKRPVVVDAEQWIGPGTLVPGVQREWVPTMPHVDNDRGYYHYYVVTAHGQMTDIAPKDWIIVEPNERGHYPCKPDIFQATYQLVGEPDKQVERLRLHPTPDPT